MQVRGCRRQLKGPGKESVPAVAKWYVALLFACIVLPYLLGVRPRGRRDWRFMVVVIAFLTWLLLGFTFVMSR